MLKKEFQYAATKAGAAAAGAAKGLSASLKNTFTKINRLYGTKGFLSVGAMFKRTYTRPQIPGSVMEGIGVICSGLPPGASRFPRA